MYEFTWLNEKLLLIQWKEGSEDGETRKFLSELYNLLNESQVPFYILVDLRHGQVTDTKTFSRIKFLTQHQNWSGSVAFYNDPISTLSNTTFQSLHPQHGKDVIFNALEEALAYLETLEPEITYAIDWDRVLDA